MLTYTKEEVKWAIFYDPAVKSFMVQPAPEVQFKGFAICEKDM